MYIMEDAEEFVGNLNSAILNPLIVLLFALAALYFVYGLFKFVANSSSDDARNQGKRHMVYGVIGMFIMVSAFALISLVLNTVGIDVPAGLN
jgi:uncharacterized membrane protein YbhN (UPF0104 family)